MTLLGPVTAAVEGVDLPLGGLKQRALFALLALNPGRVVPLDRLVDELWEDEPPSRATLSLQSYVARLRRVLADVPVSSGREPPRIVTRPPGWALTLDADQVDVTQFEALVTRARHRFVSDAPVDPGAAAAASRDLEAGLALWSGEPLAGLEAVRFAREEAARLGELRLAATELLLQAQLALGESDAVAERAARFVAAHPFRERGWAAWMLALYRCGRQSDALGAAARLRRLLADELGVDPSVEVRTLEERILRQDPSLAATSAGALAVEVTATEAPAAVPSDRAEGRAGLVGRDAVLSAVDRAVARAASGTGGLLVLEAPAGLGKSSVLQELEARVVADGGTVLRGDSVGAGSAPALWPWVSVVRALASGPARRGPDEPAEPDGEAARTALGLLEGRAPADAGGATGGAASRMRLFRAVIDAVAGRRAVQPVAVVMDDLQWADADTLTLLALAVDELVGRGVLFAVAVRSDEPGAEEALEVVDRARRTAVAHLRLLPLGTSEVARLVRELSGTEVGPDVVAAIQARTAGNPLFVSELTRLLSSERRLDAEGVRVTLPSEVRGVLRRRLARLPQQTVALLTVVAVAGGPTQADLLAEVTGLDLDAVLDGCEAAVLAGLLLDDASQPGAVVLSHDLVRQTLEQSLSTARRLRLHARIAAALQAHGPMSPRQVVEVARHLTLAAPLVGPAAAVPHLVAASDDALSRYAHDQAERHLRTALDLVAQLPDLAERSALGGPVWGRLRVLQLTVRGPQATEPVVDDAVPVSTDAEATLGWLARMIQATVTGQALWAAAAADALLAGETSPGTRFSALYIRGFASHLVGRILVARADLEAVQQLVADGVNVAVPGFFDGAVASAGEGALVAHVEGDEQRADTLLDTARRLAGSSEVSLLITVQHRLWLAAMRGDVPGARQHAAASRALADRLDYVAYTYSIDLVAAWADALQGKSSGAERADLAFEQYLATGLRIWEPMYLLLRAEAHAAWGRDRRAAELIAQSRAVAAETGEVCSSPRLLAWAQARVPVEG